MDKTGWKVVFSNTSQTYEVCNECYDEINYHAQEIHKKIEDKFVNFNSLLQ